MINIEVKEFKIKLGEKKYTFRLDFKALLKFNKRYENALELINNLLRGKDVYEITLKILCCACVEKEFTEEELEGLLAFNYECLTLIDEVTIAFIDGVGIKNEEKSDTKSEAKN